MVGDAGRDAEQRRAAAVQNADFVLAAARGDAEIERATATAAAVEASTRERAELLDAARRDADGIASHAAERLPTLTDRLVATVRAAGPDREPAR